MRLLIDMDDVIADTLNYTITCLENNGVFVNRKELSGKYLEDILTKEQVDFMHKMTNSVSYFKRIPIKPNCYSVLKKLQGQYEIRIVSCAFVFPHSMNSKYWWLRKYLDFISSRQIIFCGNKNDVYGDIIIDDVVDNLQSFDGDKYLFSAPHNINASGFKRFDTWLDIEKQLCH